MVRYVPNFKPPKRNLIMQLVAKLCKVGFISCFWLASMPAMAKECSDILYGYDEENECETLMQSEMYLQSTLGELADKGMLTDSLIQKQSRWIQSRNTECKNDVQCIYEKNFSRADELRIKAKIPLGG